MKKEMEKLYLKRTQLEYELARVNAEIQRAASAEWAEYQREREAALRTLEHNRSLIKQKLD